MSKFFNWLKKDKKIEEPSPSLQEPTDLAHDEAEIADKTLKNIDSENIENIEKFNKNKDSEAFLEFTTSTVTETKKTTPSALETNYSYIENDQAHVDISSQTETAIQPQVDENNTDNITTSEQKIDSVEPEVAKVEEKTGFFSKLKRSLSRTKGSIGSGIIGLFRGKSIDDELFEELETQLLVADLGMNTTLKLIAELTETADRKQLKDGEALYQLLKEKMAGILDKVESPLTLTSPSGPFVILMVGVNGVGKTTTIGKMAKQFQQQGKKVMLAAGDTFRAAAVEQLQVWGERNDIPVVAQQTGSDSASVIFDAFQSAKAKNIDVLIADTAGRLQNKDHLMEELKKVVRVMKKISPEAPHEIMLTLDASTGQNAVSQTKLFHEAVGLTGLTLTKLDGTAKGGVIFAIADEFNIPIRYVGIGEGIDDLRPFNSQDFVNALFTET